MCTEHLPGAGGRCCPREGLRGRFGKRDAGIGGGAKHSEGPHERENARVRAPVCKCDVCACVCVCVVRRQACMSVYKCVVCIVCTQVCVHERVSVGCVCVSGVLGQTKGCGFGRGGALQAHLGLPSPWLLSPPRASPRRRRQPPTRTPKQNRTGPRLSLRPWRGRRPPPPARPPPTRTRP